MNEPLPTCSSQDFDRASHLLGDFWTLQIVDAIREAELRFCEIERAVPAISPATLTGRLKKLEDATVICRHIETRDRQSVTYTLTDKGRGVLPVVDAIRQFTVSYN